MLQRAASNAYSWWWASHMRTKQSNWLQQNLQDMETNLQSMLQLIEQDGDTFAQRAEMYYKKRPELIHIMQEFYKGYRAVAERYDHISGDLHNARSTIATAFPEQVPAISNEADPSEEDIEQDITKNVTEATKNPPPPPPPPPSLSGKSWSCRLWSAACRPSATPRFKKFQTAILPIYHPLLKLSLPQQEPEI